MNMEDAFLAEILRHPHADVHRLVYADWLTDRGGAGDDERADFIRAGITARFCFSSGDAGYYPVCSTIHDAAGKSAPAWADRIRRIWLGTDGYLSQLPDGLRDGMEVEFRRGFIAEVRCDCRAWKGHGPAIVAAHPVEVVRLADVRIGAASLREGMSTNHPPPHNWPWQLEKYGALMDRGGFHADTVQSVEAALSFAALAWAVAEARRRELGARAAGG